MTFHKTSNDDNKSPNEGYHIDFVSGNYVKTTSEDIEAVQPFEKKLVEDLGYSKKQIQTRPQFYIKKGSRKIGPVDIAVFENEKKDPDDLYLIVECKSSAREDGKEQLKSYMNSSTAVIGAWFNGVEHLYIEKIIKENKISYREIPNIPRKGQRIEDIGRYKRKDLIIPNNLTLLFKDIRNHLVGLLTGVTRDETIAQQIIILLFCKIYDEIETNPNDQVLFRVGIDEPKDFVIERIETLFLKVKSMYNEIFTKEDIIQLDNNSLLYIISQLQDYSLIEAERDAIRKAFEVFIGPALRGSEGQFFTPRNVIKMCFDIIDPEIGDVIIDPACGSGGFLVLVLTEILKKLEKVKYDKNWNDSVFYQERNKVIHKYLKGIDKDKFLSKVTKAYMAIIGNGKENIFCENSLDLPENWAKKTQMSIKLNSFNALFTNPPFGSKIKIKGDSILSQYHLGYKWGIKDGILKMTNILRNSQAPQILFIERCLHLLKEEGKMAIVLPEGLLGNPTHEYVRKFIFENFKVLAVIDAPIETFLPNTSTKTCILFLQKKIVKNENYKIFMAIAKKCGHDSRDNIIYKINKNGEYIYNKKGRKIINDDFISINNRYQLIKNKNTASFDKNGFLISLSEIKSHNLIPRFYNPSIKKELDELRENYDLVTIGDLINKDILSLHNGQGVKKKFYGTGNIPYIRTSDITNWELKIDPTYGISEEIYEKFKQDLKEKDILFVMDGGRLIGNNCILSEERDTKCLIQSHFQILRCEKKDILNPYLLLYLLNTPIIKKQVKMNIVIQSTLATIGERIKDIYLPIPKDLNIKEKLISKTQIIVKKRAKLRKDIEDISRMSLENII
ncbi:MAG: N-6 DNA methylase [Candidatus Lokiarchaeota archaeon]|nr:N-6 DNA methylase [Candidatus Lokiarchaeota archaeon]